MSISVIPSPPPLTSRWTQQIFHFTSNPESLFVLHDHSDGICILGNTYDSFQVAEEEFKELAVCAEDDNRHQPVHVVAHIADRNQFETSFFAPPTSEESPDSRKVIVLHVSRTNSVGEDSAQGEQFIWLSMKDREAYKKVPEWLPEFLALDFDIATEIAKKPNRGDLDPEIQQNFAHLLDVTNPGDPTAAFALQKLCEAWKEVHAMGHAELSGFPITAPAILDDWLEPFSPQSNGQQATIESVVAMMGDEDTKAKARAVLNAAGTDPKHAVLTFLGKPNETPTPKGGAR